MIDLLIALLCIIGIFAVVVFTVSRVKKITLDTAFKIIWDFVKAEVNPAPPEPFFFPDAVVINRVLNSVCAHSNIEKAVTLWRLDTITFPVLSVQILPKADNALDVAAASAATICGNAAYASGFATDIETDVTPSTNSCYIIQIGMATTAAQKEDLARYRASKNANAALDAGGGQKEPVDTDLQKDLDDYSSDGDADGRA